MTCLFELFPLGIRGAKIMHLPSVDLLQNRETRMVSILHMTPIYQDGAYLGGDTSFGPIDVYSESDFNSNCVDIVRRAFDEYKRRGELAEPSGGADSELGKMPLGKRRAFYRKHKYVSLSVRDSGAVWIDPVFYEMDPLMGFSKSELRLVVNMNYTEDAFWGSLEKAFKLAQ
jgi:hypothetical protein